MTIRSSFHVGIETRSPSLCQRPVLKPIDSLRKSPSVELPAQLVGLSVEHHPMDITQNVHFKQLLSHFSHIFHTIHKQKQNILLPEDNETGEAK
jgi:hypothetical protein